MCRLVGVNPLVQSFTLHSSSNERINAEVLYMSVQDKWVRCSAEINAGVLPC